MQHLTFHVMLKNIDNIVPVSANIKFICRHDITEILFKVALNTINPPSNVCVRPVETARTVNLWRASLSCFAANTNKFYFCRQCSYIVFIVQFQNVQKQRPYFLKIHNTSVVLIAFNSIRLKCVIIPLPFPTLLKINQVPTMLYLGHCPYITNIYPVNAI